MEEDKEELERNLQYKSIVLALHQCLVPAVNGHDLNLFEQLLRESFIETDVEALLQENLKKKESRSTSVKLELEDDDNDQFEQKGQCSCFSYKDVFLLLCW